MALKVIGAGLGRTATFSMKFALEHLGFGPCYHMSEVLAGARRNIPLWLEVVAGAPDWETIFTDYQSTTDYPACTYWCGKKEDRAFMTDWFIRRNREVVETLPPERLLVFHPKQGWEPLCEFLGVPVPEGPFPRVNSRDELGSQSDKHGGLPPDPEMAEKFARDYIDELKSKAFAC